MSTLAHQGACLEHVLEIARQTGLVEPDVMQGAREARITIGWFCEHEELTKAFHRLWKRNKELAKGMSELGRHFPGIEIESYRSFESLDDDHSEISRDA